MNALPQTFTFNQSDSVRIILDETGTPMFVAKDVAIALGYADPTNAIKLHCRGVAKHHPLQTKGGLQNVRVIYEPDVYGLIFGSKLPSAVKFQDWVFNDVLPAIRKTGKYEAPKVEPVQERDYLSNNDMVNLKRLIFTATLHTHHTGSIKNAIWYRLREATQTPSPAPFETYHLPILAKEMQHIYQATLAYREAVVEAEKILIKRIIKNREDNHPLTKVLCQQIIDSSQEYITELSGQHKRLLNDDIQALTQRLKVCGNGYPEFEENFLISATA